MKTPLSAWCVLQAVQRMHITSRETSRATLLRFMTQTAQKSLNMLTTRGTSILGNMSENIKVNKRPSQAGFGYLKIGKHGYKNIYEEIYDVLGYDTAQTTVSYGFDITIGLIF